jgi:anti-sigma-K factor RskA
VFLANPNLKQLAPLQRMGTLTEKRKLELNKIAEKQRSNTKEEMNYLLEKLDAWNLGGSLISDLKFSLKEKDTKIALLQQKVKKPENSWHGSNEWLDRLIPAGFAIVAILCLLKSAGFIQTKKETP